MSSIKLLSTHIIISILALSFCCNAEETQVPELKPGFMIHPAKRDKMENLLPNLPYNEFIKKGMDFALNEKTQDEWFKGNRISDEHGKLPVFFNYSHGKPDGRPSQSEISYPARHFARYIETLIRYYNYSGDPACIPIARRLADYSIAHSTPGDWLYSNMPYSTYIKGKPGGFRDGDSINPNKSAMTGIAYIMLYQITAEAKYLKAAAAIADTLVKTQLPEGNWFFRVHPQTNKAQEPYTSALIYIVMLFDRLDEINNNTAYLSCRDKTMEWLIKNPMETMDWRGFHEDVGDEPENRNAWDITDTIDYLVINRNRDPRYLLLARKLEAFFNHTFIRHYHYFYPAEAVAEQLAWNFTMSIHSMHYAVTMAHLHQVYPEQGYKYRVEQMMNWCTYLQQPNGIIITSPDKNTFWYCVHFSTLNWMLDVFGAIPELAPDGENHLLAATAAIKEIKYADNRIVYTTAAASEDTLKIKFKPQVTVDGSPLDLGKDAFDAKTGVLRFNHPAGQIIVSKVS